jgi:ABC-type antimicrobial peptide transport system permease subunit
VFTKVEQLGILTRAFRNISRRKMRALLVIIALGFSVAIMISVPSGVVANQQTTQNLSTDYTNSMNTMQEQINQTMSLIVCSLSSSQTQTPGGAFGQGFTGRMFGGEQDYMDESIADSISSISGVQDVVPILEVPEGHNVTSTFRGFTFPRFVEDYMIVGVPLNSSLMSDVYGNVLSTNITEGRNLQVGDTGVVVMSINNTGYFGVGVGEQANILGQDFNVVGIHGETSPDEARSLYMNISDAQSLTNLTGEVSTLYVFTTSSSDDVVNSVANNITSMFADGITGYTGSTPNTTPYYLIPQTAEDRLSSLQNMTALENETLTNAELALNQTQSTANEEIVVAVVATSLIVLFVMLYTVRERTKEIGTLKALGFGNWNILSQFVLEGTLLSLAAGVVGIAIGSVGAPFLSGILTPLNINPSSTINGFSGRGSPSFIFAGASPGLAGTAAVTAFPTIQIMLLGIGASVLLGALGSLYPAWRATRTRPAEAMRYE